MIHFISDLHISSQSPGVARRFLHYLENSAIQVQQLFILGDFFEAWPGDDCIDDPGEQLNREIVCALKKLSDAGVSVSVMHGNRDFLLGATFAKRSGATLIADPHEFSVPTAKFVLSHGDALCTADHEYQAFRATVRQQDWQTSFLSRPLVERKAIAAAMRQQSERAKEDKLRQQHTYLMDIDVVATEDFLRRHEATFFIHGHTHRPAQHVHRVDNRTIERWVLADWSEDRGEALCFDGQGLYRRPL